MTKIGVEGVFTASLMVIARALVDQDLQLPELLNIFMREEVLSFQAVSAARQQPGFQLSEQLLANQVQHNVDLVMGRLNTLACVQPPEKIGMTHYPVFQPIVNVLNNATNSQQLCQMDPTWHPWM